jgi:hypothetical protein
MPHSKRTLQAELERARANGWERICLNAERRESLPKGLLLAIASRETNMNDVVGDGGHGRGLFQIDDRSHADFLASQRASKAGGKPPVAAAARYAARLVKSNLEFGRKHAVRDADLLNLALGARSRATGRATRTGGRPVATMPATSSPGERCCLRFSTAPTGRRSRAERAARPSSG